MGESFVAELFYRWRGIAACFGWDCRGRLCRRWPLELSSRAPGSGARDLLLGAEKQIPPRAEALVVMTKRVGFKVARLAKTTQIRNNNEVVASSNVRSDGRLKLRSLGCGSDA